MKLDKKLKILLFEPDKGLLRHLQQILYEIGCRHLEPTSNASDALLLYELLRPDICIIGAGRKNHEMSGISLGLKIREISADVPVILIADLCTEFEFSKVRPIRPFSYLSKDVSAFKLYQAIDIALNRSKYTEVRTMSSHINFYERYFLKIGEEYKSVPIKDIEMFFAADKITYAKVGNRNYPINTTLKTLEDHLGRSFIRIHKTYLININFLNSINLSDNSIDIGGRRLPIGYAHRKLFLSRMALLR